MTQGEKFGQILALLSENSKGILELKAMMTEIKLAKEEIEAWKPEVDSRMADLESAVSTLGERVKHLTGSNISSANKGISIEQPAPEASKAGGTGMPDSAHLGSTPSGVASGPCGHRVEHRRQGNVFGVVYATLEPSPVTGADATQNSPPVTCALGDSVCCGHHIHPAVTAALPDLVFPKFDGSNPRLWVKQCETFFDVYAVAPSLWVRYASMNLVGSNPLVPNLIRQFH